MFDELISFLAFVLVVWPIIGIILLTKCLGRIGKIEELIANLYELQRQAKKAEEAAGEKTVIAPLLVEEPGLPVIASEPPSQPEPRPEPQADTARFYPPPLPESMPKTPPTPLTASSAQPSSEPLSASPQTYVYDAQQDDMETETASEPRFGHLAALLARAYSWLVKEGNIWVTCGVIILLVGFGLLFNFVTKMGWFSLELRLAFSAAVGVALLAVGWRLREKRRTYALILQGGGLGILYVVLLAGGKLGAPVIPVAVAVVGMLILSLFTVMLAHLQAFEPLAIFALGGGFAAPILVSSDSGNYVALFSIYSLLNLEILALSKWQDWRKCRWSGLIASLAVAALWGHSHWRPEFFVEVEPFLLLYFLTYSAIGLMPLVERFRSASRFDLPLVLSLPFVYLSLQIPAARHIEYGVAIVCLALSALYMALGRLIAKRMPKEAPADLKMFFFSYCLIFANLALPFTFEKSISAPIWAIEGACLIGMAERTGRKSAYYWGGLLQAAAFILYFVEPGFVNTTMEGEALSSLLFALSALASSFFFNRRDNDFRRTLSFREYSLQLPSATVTAWLFALYGTAWCFMAADQFLPENVAGVMHVARVTREIYIFTRFDALAIAGALGCLASLRLKWPQARVLVLPAAILSIAIVFEAHDWQYWIHWQSALFYSLTFASVLLLSRKTENSRCSAIFWGVMLFTWAFFTRASVDSLITADDPALLLMVMPFVLGVLFLLVPRFSKMIGMERFSTASRVALVVIALSQMRDFFRSLAYLGTRVGIYVPVLNGVDLSELLFIAACLMIAFQMANKRVRKVLLFYVLPFVILVWLTTVARRAAWYLFGEQVYSYSAANAPHFQAILSLLWGSASLALIYLGQRYLSRPLWYIGAGLLGITSLKLLLIDLGNQETIIRIVAFMAMGGLFLFIGWLSPLPPKIAAGPEEDDWPEEAAGPEEDDWFEEDKWSEEDEGPEETEEHEGTKPQ